MNAPQLTTKAIFYKREIIEDDMGGTLSEWMPQFEAWTGVQHLRGGEAVMQARLASKNPVVLTIRNSVSARQITSEWRVALRSRSGITKEYDIREDPRPAEGDGWLEMLVEG